MQKTYRMVYERYIKGNAVYSDVDGNMNRIYIPLDEFAPMPPPQRLWVTFTDLNPSQQGRQDPFRTVCDLCHDPRCVGHKADGTRI